MRFQYCNGLRLGQTSYDFVYDIPIVEDPLLSKLKFIALFLLVSTFLLLIAVAHALTGGKLWLT